MSEQQQEHDAQLFSLRLWPEDLGHGQSEWRGQVRHLPTGETHCSRAWPAPVTFIQSKLPGLEAADQAAGLAQSPHPPQ